MNDARSVYHLGDAVTSPSLGDQMTFQATTDLRDFSLKVTVVEGT